MPVFTTVIGTTTEIPSHETTVQSITTFIPEGSLSKITDRKLIIKRLVIIFY